MTTLIRDVGVPAAILMVVLLRIEPKLDRLHESILALTAAVQLHVAASQARRAGSDPGGDGA